MKKIRKLALSSEQCMSPEEQVKVLGGGHVCTGYSWNCQCTTVGNTCEQVWTYDWSFDGERAASGGLTAYSAAQSGNIYVAVGGVIFGAYQLATSYEPGYELYQIQKCSSISNGSKSHTPVGSIRRR